MRATGNHPMEAACAYFSAKATRRFDANRFARAVPGRFVAPRCLWWPSLEGRLLLVDCIAKLATSRKISRPMTTPKASSAPRAPLRLTNASRPPERSISALLFGARHVKPHRDETQYSTRAPAAPAASGILIALPPANDVQVSRRTAGNAAGPRPMLATRVLMAQGMLFIKPALDSYSTR